MNKTIKNFKPVFNYFKKNSTRPITAHVYVDEKGAHMTDFETYLSFRDKSFDLSKGLHAIDTIGLIEPNTNKEKIECFPRDKFINSLEIVDSVTIDLETIEEFLPFASKDETRLFLNSIAVNDGHLVAVDGHTMRYVKLLDDVKNDYIIPKTSLELLVKILKRYKIKKQFQIMLNDEWAFIKHEKFFFKCRLIMREYARWQSVIPTKGRSHTLEIDALPSIKETRPLTNKRSRSSIIHVKNGVVSLKFPDHENVERVIGKTSNKKIEAKIGINLEYLYRAANKAKVFNFSYHNEMSPLVINKAIIMPMRL